MNIPELIREAHDNARSHGFYDCKDHDEYCKNCKYFDGCNYEDKEPAGSCDEWECLSCDGKNISRNKNIGELLMLIVSKLGQALEAHRCGLFADWNLFEEYCDGAASGEQTHQFECQLKDTFEDKIADVFIQLFGFCGYLGIEDLYFSDETNVNHKNIGNLLLRCTTFICNIFHVYTWDKKRLNIEISRTINYLSWLCEIWEIPIEKHVKAKMAYNKTLEAK